MSRFRSLLQPVDLVFLVGSFVAIRALLWRGLEPLGAFDEGLLFANAQMIHDQRVPYRDFYANYPPGIFQVVRAAIAWTASPIWVMRWATFVAHLATALCVGLLAGRGQRRRWSLAAFSCVLVLQADIGLVPYAYIYAVLLVLCVILLWPVARTHPVRTCACALLFGALSYLRHDVFIYITLPLLVLEAGWCLRYRHSLLFAEPRQLALFSAVVAATVIGLWLPTLVQAGLYRITHDLYFDMRDVMAARVLPIPSMLAMGSLPALAIDVPLILSDPMRFALALCGICIVAAVYVAGRRLIRRDWIRAETRTLVLCTVCALATLPQALGRSDYAHIAFGVPLVVAAGFRVMGVNAARVVSLLSILLLFAAPRPLISAAETARLWRANDASFITAERRLLTDFILSETKPNQPLFIGCSSHRRVVMSVLDLHYLAARPGATRYMQFDPGLVTKADKQLEMIADLERTRPPLIMRYSGCVWDEPNDSMLEGAALLDNYLARTYRRDGRQVSSFDIWRRLPNHSGGLEKAASLTSDDAAGTLGSLLER